MRAVVLEVIDDGVVRFGTNEQKEVAEAPPFAAYHSVATHGATTEWITCCGSLGRDSLRGVTKPVAFLVKRQVQTTRGFR